MLGGLDDTGTGVRVLNSVGRAPGDGDLPGKELGEETGLLAVDSEGGCKGREGKVLGGKGPGLKRSTIEGGRGPGDMGGGETEERVGRADVEIAGRDEEPETEGIRDEAYGVERETASACAERGGACDALEAAVVTGTDRGDTGAAGEGEEG